MFRSAVFAASRAASSRVAARPVANFSRVTRVPFLSIKPVVPLWVNGSRCYSAGGVLKEDEIKGRIMDLLKNFDKVGLLMTSIA
jgi:hypothetical protein